MTRLIAMCGLSFSGKTTLARRIAHHTGACYISLDLINEERSLYGGEGISPTEWEKTSVIAMERASGALERQIDVVLDDTLCFRWLRDRYASLARRFGAEFVLVYVATPMARIHEAMSDNQAVLCRRAIQPEVFQEHCRTFECPTPDERPLIFGREEPIERWLARHFDEPRVAP